MNLEEIKQLVTKALDLFCHDGSIDEVIPIISDIFHPEVVFVSLPYRKKQYHKGYEGVKQRYEANFVAFSNASYGDPQIIVQNNKASVLTRYTATHTGDWLGISATNKVFSNAVIYLVEVRDDKISKWQSFPDTLELFKQIGGAILIEDDKEKLEKYLNLLSSQGLIPPSIIKQT
ncbi:MAG: ester cyclase [Candidatus Kariarchaeaceae archaeon]